MSVYFIRSADGLFKIGYSADIARRVHEITRANPAGMQFLGYLPGRPDLEHHFHAMFQRQRHHGEWFDESPRLLALIAEIAIPEMPGAQKRPDMAVRVSEMDLKFVSDAAEAIERLVDEFRASDLSQSRVNEIVAPALGLTVDRFVAIRNAEVMSVSAAEYTQIMKGADLSRVVMEAASTDAETMSPVPLTKPAEPSNNGD